MRPGAPARRLPDPGSGQHPGVDKGALARGAAVGLTALAVRDLLQKKHAVQRRYPVVGHLRWAMEALRPELQQYFIERDWAAADPHRFGPRTGRTRS